ncbi:hypothetical protein QTP70_006264 [Hemibagrus guttatus]|uniref:Uncharacterized protein n=1 Tax=Hemibagrus guttatus TaxID=175788 RepID=A0AAE0RFV6_9TELE|nr:hypothetical protein QTP70_006264 [Hemibagrus guttatus]
MLHRCVGSLCLSQASSGIKAGYTLDGVPTHHRGLETLTVSSAFHIRAKIRCVKHAVCWLSPKTSTDLMELSQSERQEHGAEGGVKERSIMASLTENPKAAPRT